MVASAIYFFNNGFLLLRTEIYIHIFFTVLEVEYMKMWSTDHFYFLSGSFSSFPGSITWGGLGEPSEICTPFKGLLRHWTKSFIRSRWRTFLQLFYRSSRMGRHWLVTINIILRTILLDKKVINFTQPFMNARNKYIFHKFIGYQFKFKILFHSTYIPRLKLSQNMAYWYLKCLIWFAPIGWVGF